MLFNYFEGSNEGIIVREAQMRGSMVKCGERPLEGVGGGGGGGGGVCKIPGTLPMNDGAM